MAMIMIGDTVSRVGGLSCGEGRTRKLFVFSAEVVHLVLEVIAQLLELGELGGQGGVLVVEGLVVALQVSIAGSQVVVDLLRVLQLLGQVLHLSLGLWGEGRRLRCISDNKALRTVVM
jgi:hypothetical protein